MTYTYLKNKQSFNDIQWENTQVGMKQKIVNNRNEQLQIIRFEEDFIEEDWCTKGHYGYILDGEMKIDFNGEIISYKQGDILNIKESHKHKAIIKKGKYVEVLLFEKLLKKRNEL